MSLIHETISYEVAGRLSKYWQRSAENRVTKNYRLEDTYTLEPKGGRKPLTPFGNSYPCPNLDQLFEYFPNGYSVLKGLDGLYYLVYPKDKVDGNKKLFAAEKIGDIVAEALILEVKIIKH